MNEAMRLDEITLMVKIVDRAMRFKDYDREALFNSLALLRYAMSTRGENVDWRMMLDSPSFMFRYFIGKLYRKDATQTLDALFLSDVN